MSDSPGAFRRAEGKIPVSKDRRNGSISFNNPERAHAMSPAMWGGLKKALDGFDCDDRVRAVILHAPAVFGVALPDIGEAVAETLEPPTFNLTHIRQP